MNFIAIRTHNYNHTTEVRGFASLEALLSGHKVASVWYDYSVNVFEISSPGGLAERIGSLAHDLVSERIVFKPSK